MDGFEWNKVFGAVLGVAFVVFGLSLAGEALYHPDENDPATVLDLPEAVVAASGDAAPKGAEPILALLASADLAAGENSSKKCAACHIFEKGGQNKVGPHIYGVIGRDIASVSDFGYSSALREYGAGKQWTYEEMNGFLWKPRVHVRGTSMGFAGLSKPEERANIIAWMNSKSDNPLPPPTPEQIAAEAPPAEGEAAPAEGAAVPAAAEGVEAVTPAANKTGDPNAEGAIVVDPDVPGAVVAPAGENALGEDAAAPAAETDGAATVGDNPVPSTAAPETIAPKSTADGASLPLAPDAANPRAGAQSDSTGQQGLAPAQVEQMNDGTAAPAAAETADPAAAPAAPAATPEAPAATPAPTTTPATPAPATDTTGDTGTQTFTVPVQPAD